MDLKTLERKQDGEIIVDKIVVDDIVNENASNVLIDGNILIGTAGDDIHYVNSFKEFITTYL